MDHADWIPFFSGSSLLVETSALCGDLTRLLTGLSSFLHVEDDIFLFPLTSLGGFPQNSLKSMV